MRWLILGVSNGFVVGCAEEPEGLDGGAPFAMGSFAPADGAGEWVGVEVLESHGMDLATACGRRRTLRALVEGEVCAGCELALEVTEADAPDAEGVCDPDRDGLLQAGARLSFVPRRDDEGVGDLLVDVGDGPEELGAGVFDGATLSWRRALSTE